LEQGPTASAFKDLTALVLLVIGEFKIMGSRQPVGISLAQMQCGKSEHLAAALKKSGKARSKKCEVLETKNRELR
jgi:hypothetical protein